MGFHLPLPHLYVQPYRQQQRKQLICTGDFCLHSMATTK
jgi:hypothetical protein